MKILLLVLMVTNFAFGGVIVPEVRRDQSIQNQGVLGAAWTKKKSHIGYYGIYRSDTENQGDLTLNSYNEKINVEFTGDDDGEVVDLLAKVGWKLEDAVIGVDFYHDGGVVDNTSNDLAYGMKHSGNIYSGFAIRTTTYGDVTSNQFYGGIGYYNEFDENKKSAYELYLRINSGEYNSTTSEELRDYKSIQGSITEIVNDYQYYGRFLYKVGESEKNSYDYDVVSLFGEVERKLNEYWFISLGYVYASSNRDYNSGSTTETESNTFSIKLRWLLNNTHQINANLVNSDESGSGISTEVDVISLSYQYLWD